MNNDELLAKLYNRLAEALEEIDDAITDPTQEDQ